MQIEQALYGECSGGHSLLVSSGDEAVSTEIVQRLDLPDTAPPGVDWSPFLRGFPYRDRYVLARTFRDTGASRGGMVFSHALLAPLDEIGKTPDLGPLLNLLATSDRQRPDATSVQFARSETRIRQAIDLMDTAEVLVASGPLPVVRLGHLGFDDLVAALWAHLLPEIRRGFAFRLSFDPRDLIEIPMPALVCTPPAMAARWSEYPVIRSVARRREPGSLAAAILSGDGNAAPLREFMQEMGVSPAAFSDLRLVEQAYRFDIGDPSLERRLGALRLIEKLSPDARVGKGGKDVRVQRLCGLVRAAKAEDIRLLRNVRLSAFPSPNRIWKALETWVAENSYPPDQDAEMLSVFEDATSRKAALKEWRSAVLGGLAAATRSPRSSFARAFWRWLQIRPEIVVAVFRHVPVEAGVEERLVTVTPPNLDEAAAKTLAAPALSRKWLRLHGALLSASCPALEAARRQILVDTDLSFVKGLKSALRQATPRDFVECALVMEDPRLPRLAGEAVAKDPSLLAEADVTQMKAQVIWREALAIDPESWRGPADPAGALHSILDRLLDGGETDPTLLERLSDTPLAGIGTYLRRAEIWSRIGGVALHNFRTATAKGWLRQATSVGGPLAIEHALQTSILEGDQLEQTLDALIPTRVGTALRIVRALAGYDQQRFLLLLRKSTSRATSLGVSDAEGIGRLVLERRWDDVAANLVGQYRTGRRDLKPALRACCDMLGFWERISLGLVAVSEGEKWEGFLELGAELYPGGPDKQGLWERAGGDDADLSSGGDGRTRWRKAVRNIRNGKGPAPSALLAEMQRDYPNNRRIRHLAGDRVFGGGDLDGMRDE